MASDMKITTITYKNGNIETFNASALDIENGILYYTDWYNGNEDKIPMKDVKEIKVKSIKREISKTNFDPMMN